MVSAGPNLALNGFALSPNIFPWIFLSFFLFCGEMLPSALRPRLAWIELRKEVRGQPLNQFHLKWPLKRRVCERCDIAVVSTGTRSGTVWCCRCRRGCGLPKRRDVPRRRRITSLPVSRGFRRQLLRRGRERMSVTALSQWSALRRPRRPLPLRLSTRISGRLNCVKRRRYKKGKGADLYSAQP